MLPVNLINTFAIGAPTLIKTLAKFNPPLKIVPKNFVNPVMVLKRIDIFGKIPNINLPINLKKPPRINLRIPPNVLFGFFLFFGSISVPSSSPLSVSNCFSLSLLLSVSLCCFNNPSLTFDKTNFSFNNPSILTTFFLMIIRFVTPSLDKSVLLEVLFDNSFEVSIILLHHP